MGEGTENNGKGGPRGAEEVMFKQNEERGKSHECFGSEHSRRGTASAKAPRQALLSGFEEQQEASGRERLVAEIREAGQG